MANIEQDKSQQDDYPSLDATINDIDCEWSETLIAQHQDLNLEITLINELLDKNRCSLIQLDVHLKKLSKGLLTHLQLEAEFLTPILAISDISSQQKTHLNTSFDALFSTCRETMKYIHSLKIKWGNSLVTRGQQQRISDFINEINKRLQDENIIYSQMANNKGRSREV